MSHNCQWKSRNSNLSSYAGAKHVISPCATSQGLCMDVTSNKCLVTFLQGNLFFPLVYCIQLYKKYIGNIMDPPILNFVTS